MQFYDIARFVWQEKCLRMSIAKRTDYLLSYCNARNGIDEIDIAIGVYADRMSAIAHVEGMGYEKTGKQVPHDRLPVKDLLSVVGIYKRRLSQEDGDDYIEIEEWRVR